MFRDLVDSLKRKNNDLKITFLANPYLWSCWFLEHIPNLQESRKKAQELAKKGDNSGVRAYSKDKKWMLYLNLLPGKTDLHSEALEEQTNPSLRNWDDFMLDKNKIAKYQILHSIQDFYFCVIGERKKFKKYCLMHFTKNKKETDNALVNFCFNLEEVARSKLKNCRVRDKAELLDKWIKMLKSAMLYFVDYQGRDWFLKQIKGLQEPSK